MSAGLDSTGGRRQPRLHMRAAVMRDRKLIVADVPTPEPWPGEVLVRTLACGICGSDLHALKHADKFVETSRRAGGRPMDLTRDVVMGHEFCVEIVEHGPRTTRALRPGTRVCSRPVLLRDTGPQTIGYSNDHPGGYGELMRLTESLLLPVPTGSRPRPPRSPSRWQSACTP